MLPYLITLFFRHCERHTVQRSNDDFLKSLVFNYSFLLPATYKKRFPVNKSFTGNLIYHKEQFIF